MSIRSRHSTTILSAGVLATSLVAAMNVPAQEPIGETALTIYSTTRPGAVPPDLYRPVAGQGVYTGDSVPGYAMIRQVRSVDLKQGTNRLDFRDVAAYIDPTTVALRVAHVARRHARDRAELPIRSREHREAHGALHRSGHHGRSTDGQSRRADSRPAVEHARRFGLELGRRADPLDSQLREHPFPDVAGRAHDAADARSGTWRPSARASRTRASPIRLPASPGGRTTTWCSKRAPNANNGFLDVGAWVSILNRSGADYPDARLKLIAGDVQPSRAGPQPMAHAHARRPLQQTRAGFAEQSFFEFHLYTLGPSDDDTGQLDEANRALSEGPRSGGEEAARLLRLPARLRLLRPIRSPTATSACR